MLFLLMFQMEYHCPYEGCVAKFTTQLGYVRHKNRHEGIYPYHCPYCNNGYSATKNVKEHLKLQHTGMYGFHCVKCHKEFEKVQLLKSHLAQNTCVKKENNSTVS